MLRFALVLSLLVAAPALAVEGMWQPSQLPALEAQMRKAGIAVDPKQVAELSASFSSWRMPTGSQVDAVCHMLA